MEGAGLKTIAVAAATVVLLSVCKPGSAAAHERAATASSRVEDRVNSIADVIPAPAQVEPGRGVFALRTGTRLSIPRDPEAVRIAAYLAELLRASHGIAVNVSPRSDERGAPAAPQQ